MGYVKKQEGIEALKTTVGFLEKEGIDYWLGRGLFRHFTLHKEFRNKLSDIDFHVWVNDRPKVQQLLHKLREAGYRIKADWDYKANFTTPSKVDVEIVYLFRDDEEVYHESKGRHPRCSVGCFGDRKINIFGVNVRVPNEEYLPQVYGENWKEEIEE